MACDCFNQAKKMIREQTGDPLANMRGVIAIVKGTMMFLPSIAVLYRKKKKDGTFRKNNSEIDLTYGYCPFCGKKLIENE